MTVPDTFGHRLLALRELLRPHKGNEAEDRDQKGHARQRKCKQRNAIIGVEHVAGDRVRGQDQCDHAENDGEDDCPNDIVLRPGLEQRALRVLRVHVDIDVGAQRISGDLLHRQQPRRHRHAADPDTIAFEVVSVDAVAIANDRRGVGVIVG